MENKITQKKCLLISPQSFYFYSEYLSKTLASYNYDVVVSNDEYPDNTFGKIMGKLKIPLLRSITEKKILKDFVEGNTYDLVLIIKGRGISPSLLKALKQVSTQVIGYSFDSFKYFDAPLKWLKDVDKFYTFDYRDGDKHNIPIIELFSSMPENNDEKVSTYKISAIVRNHSDRLKYINDVLSNLDEKNIFVFIYEQNIITFLQNFINNPLLYIKFWKHISFKPLPYKEYIRVLNESDFTIDFAHPAQSGITIRCFEALSSQTKIITNNPFVKRNKYFTENNVIIFENNSDSTILKKKFRDIESKIPVKNNRSINNFIEDLIK
ncbi:hypothetical protein LV84_04208 [Algoriphagus ratkowskyi]|uniref:Capsular polysaccharide biosynthesis protein n=1 Tax=Algoriphagus ratkowskyi TaxID=57028 RepID=A0A2W7R177_9BACT|nr:hypothetical protein [Algoriphagus ratkowskyi]PZX49677.1 hypothetical protein LV84_04208 [Algoriphagus ratkowskyi]TXD75450.1 hypothetical protein ESW18_20495 [Algoriphagus ratkowskyi]